MSVTPLLGLLSQRADPHVWTVKKRLETHFDARAVIVPSDTVVGSGGTSWSASAHTRQTIPIVECCRDCGPVVHVGELDALWFRRSPKQATPEEIDDDSQRALIDADCDAALMGALLTDFHGRWVSDPEATRLSANKLLQLRAASAAGLRVPRTLVSQNPGDIRAFCAELGNAAIVKNVRGVWNCAPPTTEVCAELLERSDVLALCPATYQELIPGDRHLRIHCFGDRVLTAMITTTEVDSRYDLNVPIVPYELDETTHAKVMAALSTLGLCMGIVDLKLTPEGEPVWLEVNAQGQWLFIEGLCELPLVNAMSEFLYERAVA